MDTRRSIDWLTTLTAATLPEGQPYPALFDDVIWNVGPLTVRGDLDSALVVFRNEAAAYPDYRLGHLTHALTALTAKKYAEAETSALAYAGADAELAAAMTAVIRGAAGTAPLPAAT